MQEGEGAYFDTITLTGSLEGGPIYPNDYTFMNLFPSLIINTGVRYNLTQRLSLNYNIINKFQWMESYHRETSFHSDPENTINKTKKIKDFKWFFYPLHSFSLAFKF